MSALLCYMQSADCYFGRNVSWTCCITLGLLRSEKVAFGFFFSCKRKHYWAAGAELPSCITKRALDDVREWLLSFNSIKRNDRNFMAIFSCFIHTVRNYFLGPKQTPHFPFESGKAASGGSIKIRKAAGSSTGYGAVSFHVISLLQIVHGFSTG